jgi:hypothetical protein
MKSWTRWAGVALAVGMVCRVAIVHGTPARGNELMVTIVAGTGAPGFSGDDGAARSASLNGPSGLAFDAAGNLYVGDASNHRVRKISVTTGIISTIAGTGREADDGDGGPAVNAALLFPSALSFDRAGNLFIAGPTRLRRIDATTGIISTVAGTGDSGFGGDGGPATAARLGFVTGIAVDGSGNLYIADQGAHRLRKVTGATGIITTVAGDGLACPHSDFGENHPTPGCMTPFAVTTDRAGSVYFTDGSGLTIRKLTADGVLKTIAGDGDFGIEGEYTPAVNARLESPGGIAVDADGNIFVLDAGRLRMVSADTGRISTIAGKALHFGPMLNGQPALYLGLDGFAMTLDASGRIYLADYIKSQIETLAPRTHDQPLVGDMDGDGRSDLVVWRPSNGTWFWLTSSTGFNPAAARSVQWGAERLGDIPLLGDIDGDGKGDPVVWRASTGTWYWMTSSSGYNPAAAGSKQWGAAREGDVPLLGDLDGDGRADLVVWRPSDGTWYWLSSSTGYAYGAAGGRQWGSGSQLDVPLLGDVDGDGKADLVVWRGSLSQVSTWYCLTSASNYTASRQAWTAPDYMTLRGFLADMDGDGRSDLVTWEGFTGKWSWQTAATNFDAGTAGQRQWGTETLIDQPFVADIDGDGQADLVVWRPSDGTWYWLTSSTGYAYGAAGARQWGS